MGSETFFQGGTKVFGFSLFRRVDGNDLPNGKRENAEFGMSTDLCLDFSANCRTAKG